MQGCAPDMVLTTFEVGTYFMDKDARLREVEELAWVHPASVGAMMSSRPTSPPTLPMHRLCCHVPGTPSSPFLLSRSLFFAK